MSAEATVGLRGHMPYPTDDATRPRLALAEPAAPPKPHIIEDRVDIDRYGHVDELCDDMAAVCESAVDPLEIAAALEFEGMGDRVARERYGYPDVFALAEEMYRRVPFQPTEPPPTPDLYQRRVPRPMLHALLYGLPAVCFPAATGLLSGRSELTVLIVSLLVSWSTSQALAYLGYRRLGWTDLAQARRLLRAGLVVGMALVVLALAVTALVVPAGRGSLAFGAGQGAYMLGAGVLMVLGVERVLMVVLAPSVLGATAFVALGRPPMLEHGAWTALAAAPTLAVIFAVAYTRPTGPPVTGRLFTAAELRSALPSAAFGLLAAALLAFPVAVGLPGHRGVNTGAMLAALPLSLSMGVAEWSLHRYRQRTQQLLRTIDQPGSFRRHAAIALTMAVLQYLAAASLLIGVAVVIAAKTRLVQLEESIVPGLLAYLALGGAMFVALLLQTFAAYRVTLIACATALTYEIVFRGWGLSAQVAAYAGLFALLSAYAAVVLGRAVRHTY